MVLDMSKSSKLEELRKHKRVRGREYHDDLLETILETLEEILEELRIKK